MGGHICYVNSHFIILHNLEFNIFFCQGVGSTGESTISVVPSGIHFSTQDDQDIISKEEEVEFPDLCKSYLLNVL